MKRMFLGVTLAVVASAFAQQQPPTNRPPYTTPPTFPEGRTQQEMPPDTKAPPPQGLSDAQVDQQIQDKLEREPDLANTKIGVKTNAKSVTITGLVDTERQHDLALRIAQAYAGDRKIVDKIKIRRQA
jgi:osmotically-inducible protein OsmY